MNGTEYYHTDSGNVEFIVVSGHARHYPWHMHARHWTVGVVYSGRVELTTEYGIQKLDCGARFFIEPFVPHSLSIAQGSSLLVVCADILEVLTERSGVLEAAAQLSILSQEHKNWKGRIFTQTYSEKWFHGSQAHRNSQIPKDSFIYRSVQAIKERMLDNPGAFSGLEQMAVSAGYSRGHFLRAFHAITGMTPHAFMILCRLRLLRSLLRADTASADAAASAGFSDQSHMHKAFKHHHCMTPGQFKKASFRL